MLSAILSVFRGKPYKDIPAPQLHESEEVPCILNDSVAIESKHLRHGMNARADRKLYVTSVFASFLRDIFKEDDTAHFALDDMSIAIDRGYFSKNGRKMLYNCSWSDVQMTGRPKNTHKSTGLPEDVIRKAFLDINRCTSCSLLSQSLMLIRQ